MKRKFVFLELVGYGRLAANGSAKKRKQTNFLWFMSNKAKEREWNEEINEREFSLWNQLIDEAKGSPAIDWWMERPTKRSAASQPTQNQSNEGRVSNHLMVCVVGCGWLASFFFILVGYRPEAHLPQKTNNSISLLIQLNSFLLCLQRSFVDFINSSQP